MRVATIARDLCILTDWYSDRPAGLTFRELGERYAMTESGAHHVVTCTGGRGTVCHLLWPVVCQRLLALKDAAPDTWAHSGATMVLAVLEERLRWTQCLIAFADDRRELARLKGSQ